MAFFGAFGLFGLAGFCWINGVESWAKGLFVMAVLLQLFSCCSVQAADGESGDSGKESGTIGYEIAC